MTRSRRRKPIRQRHGQSWITLAVIVAVCVGIPYVWWRSVSGESPVPTSPEATQQPAATASTPRKDSESGLRAQVEKFSALYVSPPTDKRRLLLRGLCDSDSAYATLGAENDERSTAGQGRGVSKIVVKIDRSAPNEFESSVRDGVAKVTSSMFVTISSPGQDPFNQRVDLQTVWNLRELDGWKFVGFINME